MNTDLPRSLILNIYLHFFLVHRVGIFPLVFRTKIIYTSIGVGVMKYNTFVLKKDASRHYFVDRLAIHSFHFHQFLRVLSNQSLRLLKLYLTNTVLMSSLNWVRNLFAIFAVLPAVTIQPKRSGTCSCARSFRIGRWK